MYDAPAGSSPRRVYLLVMGLALVLLSGAGGCGQPDRRTAAVDASAGPVAHALREHDRDAYDALVRHMTPPEWQDAAPDASQLRLHVYLRAVVVPKYIALADDESVRHYMRVTIAALEELRARSFYRCFVFLYGEGSTDAARARLEETLSPETRAATLVATASLIRSAGTVPVSIDESAAWLAIDNTIIPALPAWMGERKMVLRDATSRNIDRVAACDVTIDAYRLAADLDTPAGPLVMRYLLGRQLMDGV